MRGLPGLETPRTGAVDRLRAVVLAVLLHALLIVDRHAEAREVEHQVGVGLVQLVLDGVGVGGAQVLHVAGAPFQRRLGGRIEQALEAVDHVGGGELLAASRTARRRAA